MGRIFGFAAMVRAGLAARDPAIALAVTEQLVAAGAARSFLREAASGVVAEMLVAAPLAVAAHVLEGASGLRAMLTASPAEASPEVGCQCPACAAQSSRLCK